MRFRKISADKVFDGFQLLNNTVVVIGDDGTIKDLVPKDLAGEDTEICNGILSPAFINCHCHLELSHMKSRIPEKTGLVNFVVKVVNERHHPEEEILHAIERAEDEMLFNGIIAVGDICNNTLTVKQKQKQRLHYYNFIEASGWLPSVSQARFERVTKLVNEFSILSSQTSTVPHAPYSVSENLWQQIQPHFQNKVVTIHNQETAFEDEFFSKATGDMVKLYQLMSIDNTHHQPTGKTSLRSYFNKLTKAEKIILVHNTFITKEDIDFVRRKMTDVRGEATEIISETSDVKLETVNYKPQTFFCLCVNANLYIEDALPPIDLMRSNNCNIVLGTDSLASNRSLNIMEEIKTIRKNFPSIPLKEILQWATINGARALQMENGLGSFKAGKKPGIILINEEDFTVKRII